MKIFEGDIAVVKLHYLKLGNFKAFKNWRHKG